MRGITTPPPQRALLQALKRLKAFSRPLFWLTMPFVIPAAILSVSAARMLILGGKVGWWLVDAWGGDPYDFL